MPLIRGLFLLLALLLVTLATATWLWVLSIFWLILGLLLCLGGILLAVLKPELHLFGAVIARGPTGKRQIALTFDDGPHPAFTPQVLQILATHGAKATFFVIGAKAERYPDVIRAIADAGHTLALHGYDHNRLYAFLSPAAVRRDVERSQAVVASIAKLTPRLLRPPVGQVSPRTLAGAKAADVELVLWSVRGRDGLRGATAEGVLKRIVKGLHDGAVVMMHDAAERDDRTPVSIAALPGVLQAIAARGLTVVPLAELCQLRPYA